MACGSRSNLEAAGGPDTVASSAGGGATSVTASGTGGGAGGGGGTGGAGAGGAALGCGVLELTGPPAWLEGGFGYHERHPVWTLSSDDGAQVTLVYSRQAAEGPAGGDFPVSVMHTTLEPWTSFPAGGSLGPEDLADPEGGTTFAAARAPGDRIGLLFAGTPPPEGGILFSNDVVPFQSTPPVALVVDPFADEALFATEGPGGHLIGVLEGGASGGGPVSLFEAALVGDDGSLAGPVALGCASGAMHADAVRTGSGWLIAFSSGGPPGGGDCLDPGLSWPDEVHVVLTNGFEYTPVDSLGAPGGATDVKMAARSDGAWVVVGTPPGQVVNGMFLGARVDLEGHVVSMFPVGGGEPNQEIPWNGTLTTAAVGDHLAAAWIDSGGDKGPFLRVKVFDPAGNPAGHLEIFPGTSFSGAPALLGSPETASLVLAWSETPDQGMGDGDKIRAVRIDCAGAP